MSMSYVFTDNTREAVKYPYTNYQLRLDNPNVSFPANLTAEQLAEFHVYAVKPTPQPRFDPITEELRAVAPVLDGKEWAEAWEISPVSPEQEAANRAGYEGQTKERADALLLQSDPYVVEAMELGKTLTQEFKDYRAALRDPASLPGYPVATEFPALPAAVFAEAP